MVTLCGSSTISSNTVRLERSRSGNSIRSTRKSMKRLFNKRSHKKIIRYSIALTNVLVISAVALFVVQSQHANQQHTSPILSATANAAVANPLDQLSSADIAVHAARLVRLDEAVAVAEKADSVSAQLAIVPSDSSIVSKPQVVNTAQKSRRDIQTYISQGGDTVSSVAAKFNVTSDTIRWSNGLTTENIPAGKELLIAPRNGVIYTVKAGDTPDALAQRYKASKELIIAFNDAEVTGLPVGERILIPDGTQPVAATSRATASAGGSYSFGGAPIYGFNGYDRGYCTWYVANKRAAIGRPIPSNLGHAAWWKANAQRAGLGVGTTPAAGAVAWKVPSDYYGHVAYVEEVYPDGSMLISEMNVVGWNRVSTQVVSAANIRTYSFIY